MANGTRGNFRAFALACSFFVAILVLFVGLGWFGAGVFIVTLVLFCSFGFSTSSMPISLGNSRIFCWSGIDSLSRVLHSNSCIFQHFSALGLLRCAFLGLIRVLVDVM